MGKRWRWGLVGSNAVVVVVVVVEEVFRFRSRLLLLNDLVPPGFNPFDPHVIVVGRHESRRLRRRQVSLVVLQVCLNVRHSFCFAFCFGVRAYPAL